MNYLDKKLKLEEWKECRQSIDRFDKIIVDLRKYGFSLVTGLLTAVSFLFIGIHDLSPIGKVGISVLMMLLIYALFIVDRYHEVFLRCAAKRAEIIEGLLKFGLTKEISKYSNNANSDTWGH